MPTCTINKKIQIVEGKLLDYKKLSRFHYRNNRPGPFKKIYTAKLNKETIGVIVYSMPPASVELRNKATNNYFANLDRRSLVSLVNRNIRTISRVIIEPRFRGLGLAVRLVRETMPLLNVPLIEALAVMGHTNPFFEKAGMTAYKAPLTAKSVRMKEALGLIGIDGELLIDADAAQLRIDNLPQGKTRFIEREIKSFLSAYGNRRYMPPGLERTQFVLSKLTRRCVYYIWQNPKYSGVNLQP